MSWHEQRMGTVSVLMFLSGVVLVAPLPPLGVLLLLGSVPAAVVGLIRWVGRQSPVAGTPAPSGAAARQFTKSPRHAAQPEHTPPTPSGAMIEPWGRDGRPVEGRW